MKYLTLLILVLIDRATAYHTYELFKENAWCKDYVYLNSVNNGPTDKPANKCA